MGGHYSKKDANVDNSIYAQFGTSGIVCLLPLIKQKEKISPKKVSKIGDPATIPSIVFFEFFVSWFGPLL